MDINSYIKRKSENSKPRQAEDLLNKYSTMNEEQLMQEMFRAARDGRASGQITDQTLDNFYNQALAFLSPEQAERMRELIIQLKQ